jgi:hypothetical protein
VRKPLRIVLAAALPAAVALAVLAFPQVILAQVIMPAATALWLVLRTFVLSVGQQAWWWGLVVLAAFGSVALVLRRASAADGAHAASAARPWDPARRWGDCIRANLFAPPVRDTFRADAAWLLSTLYAGPRPGTEAYVVRDALRRQEIPLPPAVHEFLFAEVEPPRPVPPLFRDPRGFVQGKLESMRRDARQRSRSRRRAARYIHSAEEVLAFMETQMEVTHEPLPRA